MTSTGLQRGLIEWRRLDDLAAGTSWLHRLDARIKLLVTVAFLFCVLSYGPHVVVALLPYVVYPVAVLALAGLPSVALFRKLAVVLPVALIVALPNLLFDRAVVAQVFGHDITGGALSVLSIVLRAGLALGATWLLVAVTGFPELCHALGRLGLPRMLVVQLLFLYRYLGVLADEALRLTQARELRSHGQPLVLRQVAPLVGALLLRSWARAERIHLAMCARGFDGRLRTGGLAGFGRLDLAWLLVWLFAFALLRANDLALWLGRGALALLGQA